MSDAHNMFEYQGCDTNNLQISNYKSIPLTQDKFATIDNEDYERISKHKWYAQKIGNMWYAARSQWDKNKKEYKLIYMHREIMDCPFNMDIDHQNHDGLNNRKCNLRICTRNQNCQNRRSKSISGYKGVYLISRQKNYKAIIKYQGKIKYLGSFKYARNAAKAYDKKAKELFGDFAHTNF